MLDGIAEPLENGTWINSKVARVSEIIREQWPDLEIAWIPRERRDPGDAAFAILERLRDGRQVVAFYVQTEADFDERVLERIIRSDMVNRNPHAVNAQVEAQARAENLVREKELRERVLDNIEPYTYALKSGKHKYTGSGGKQLYFDY